jgi:ABC-type transporter Mla subunit MlaD
MRRALGIAVILAALGAFVALSTGAGQDSGKGKYWVEFDNAFGLIQGGDLKIAGVRAGTITDIKLDKRTKHALVGFKITQNGFGSLRSDVHCE